MHNCELSIACVLDTAVPSSNENLSTHDDYESASTYTETRHNPKWTTNAITRVVNIEYVITVPTH